MPSDIRGFDPALDPCPCPMTNFNDPTAMHEWQVILLEHLGNNPAHGATLGRLLVHHVDLAANHRSNNAYSPHFNATDNRTRIKGLAGLLREQHHTKVEMEAITERLWDELMAGRPEKPTPQDEQVYRERNVIDCRLYQWAVTKFAPGG